MAVSMMEAATRPLMEENEAWQTARAEGLSLITSSNKTGFLNVSLAGRERCHRFCGRLRIRTRASSLTQRTRRASPQLRNMRSNLVSRRPGDAQQERRRR